MAKIKCPECGATNQDVTAQEPCWQCGHILGEAVSATAPVVETPPTVSASPALPAAPVASAPSAKTTPAAPPVQPSTQLPAPQLQKQPARSPASLFIAVAVIVIGLVLLYLAFKH